MVERKKTPKADLESRRGMFFGAGLFVALAAVVVAFAIPARESTPTVPETNSYIEAPIEFIDITYQRPPEVPVAAPTAPVVADMLAVVGNDVAISLELQGNDLGLPEDELEAGEGNAEMPFFEEELLDDPAPILVAADAMPSFGGGDLNLFRKWVSDQFRYPAGARDGAVQGIVTVEFFVEKDGSVTGVRITSSPDSRLAEEVSRIVNSSPSWLPGKRNGVPARFKYIMQVEARLRRA